MNRLHLSLAASFYPSIKPAIFLLFFLFTVANSLAQQSTLKDILRLSVGDKWTYSYSYDSYGTRVHAGSSKSGTVSYLITGRVITSDSTVWSILQKRVYTTVVYQGPTLDGKDSTVFNLVEKNKGNHEIYSTNSDASSLFSFTRSTADTSKFYRYVESDSTSNIIRNLTLLDIQSPYDIFQKKYKFTLSSDSGIVKMTYNYNNNMVSHSAAFTFLKHETEEELRPFVLKDVFPLAVGNKWTYSFYTDSYGTIANTGSSQTGTVSYRISGRIRANDSTIWNVFQKREFTNVVLQGTTLNQKDSTVFKLVEIPTGNHEIHSTSSDASCLFPFIKSVVDTSKFFRYILTKSITDIPVNLTTLDIQSASSIFKNVYKFTLRGDTGIALMNYSYHSNSLKKSASYTLLKFEWSTSLQPDESGDNVILYQNFPNPFNQTTNITYFVPQPSFVEIRIYDLLGREIKSLINEEKPAGKYLISIDCDNLATGVYFYRITAGGFTAVKKLIHLK
jgi:hypothetical protein